MSGEMTVTRVFDAPRELVWRMFTEPEHFAAWFGTPPVTTSVDTVVLDVRPGGEWQATMVSEDGDTRLPFVGRYREVVEPERLVFTLENPDDRSDPRVEVVTVTLSELDGRTEVVLHQAGHQPPEQYERMQRGYTAFLAAMADHLAEL